MNDDSAPDTSVDDSDRFCPSCGQHFPANAEVCGEDATPLRRVGVGADLTGKTLHRKYLLLERLGEGAFGAVYRALHLLGRAEVAVKLLHADRDANPTVRKLFLREARAVMRIRSPNAVLVHDIDEDDDGRLFIVMELLAGHTLLDELRAQRTDPPRLGAEAAREVLLQLATALDAAHAEGVVHRDVKPANVMVETLASGAMHVRLVDFGIARLATVAATETTELIGPTTGTPAYMSPEQAMGKPVGGASDYYSLGAMTYHLLTGELPFTSETAQGLMMAHIAETLPRLDASHPQVELPADLVEVVARLMHKEPAQRPASREQILALMAAPAAAAPVAPATEPPASKAMAPPAGPRPRRAWVWLVAVVVALVAGGGVVAALSSSSGEHEASAPAPAAAPVVVTPATTDEGATVARPVAPPAATPSGSIPTPAAAKTAPEPAAPKKAMPTAGPKKPAAGPKKPAATPKKPAAVATKPAAAPKKPAAAKKAAAAVANQGKAG